MLEMQACKNGQDVEIWGSFEGLTKVYAIIGRFWSDDTVKTDQVVYENRDKTISAFAYEIRKAFSGNRFKKKNETGVELFGCKLSWIHVLFALSALRYNMRLKQTRKLDIALFIELEHWLEEAMVNYDREGHLMLKGFIDGGIYAGNPYLYQYMRGMDLEFKNHGTGKKAFRNLPVLLRRGVYGTRDYMEYEVYLETQAKKHGCKVFDMEFND